MKHFTYNVDELEKLYGVSQGFFSNDVIIIDNEIQNDISDDWNYTKARICVTGILYQDQIRIFVAEKENDEDFKMYVSDEIKSLGQNAPIYAFNRNMEMGNFKGDFGIEIPIKEIKPFNAKGWNKDKFFETLRNRNVIPDIQIKDIFKGDAGLCIDRWEKYQRTGDFQNMMDIVSHNINCLLKESVIQKHKKFFHDNWNIDSNGFMLSEKKK